MTKEGYIFSFNTDEPLSKKIEVFLELAQKEENDDQLLMDFEDFYLGEKKPILPPDVLQRLFNGYMKFEGLLGHIKSCHTNLES